RPRQQFLCLTLTRCETSELIVPRKNRAHDTWSHAMFSIGAFSRLAQLSVRVLRHYDEIGLLKPAHISRSNGYRYYTAEQLAHVNRIVGLKDLGLPLEQIQALVKEKHSIDAVAGMLRLEKLRAEQERLEAERRLRDLDHRLAELSGIGRLSEINIVEKSVAS